MNFSTLFRLMVILAVLGLTACTAFQLRDANQQLTSYYYAKKQAEVNKDWRMLEGTMASLSKLAEDAAKQAENEKDNVLNQIAFYRIAVTAAWQAEAADILAYADEGQKLCTEENFKRAPRDCSMLYVFPLFASVDETTNGFEALQKKLRTTPEGQINALANDAEKIFKDYQRALTSILKQRPRLAQSETHPDFLKALDQNTGNLLCRLIETNAVGLIATVGGDVDHASCEVFAMKKRALDDGLDKSSVECLPESSDNLEKPQNCP